MEVSLKKAGFQVTTAIHGKDALEKVQISPPDLVLSETRMPEMDGLELCKVLKSDERFKGIPFVFLTSQKGVEVKVKGLEQGADDYLTKPIYIKEVVTRVRMILQKVEKERSDRRETKNGFAGNLADMGVVDLVQTFEIGRKTGTIKLEGDRAGVVYFKEGRVIDAELGRLRGENAFYRMLNTFEGKFEVSFVASDRPERIEVSTQGLLMEGMRRLDEWGRMLEQLPPLETIFELDYSQLSDRLAEIPDEVNGLLRLFDGRRTLSRVVDDSDFEDLAALGIISKLYFEGLIREVGAAPAGGDEANKKPGIEEWLNTGPAPQGGEANVAPAVTPAVALPPAPPPIVPAAVSLREQLDAAEPEVPTAPTEVPIEVEPPTPVTSEPPVPLPPPRPSQPKAEVHRFEPRPKGARPTPPPPARAEPPRSSPSQFLVAEPPNELERARRRLLDQWSSIEGEGLQSDSGWGATSGWHRYDSRSTPAPQKPPEPEQPPVFGGAALERRDLAPVKPMAPVTIKPVASTPSPVPVLPPEPVSATLSDSPPPQLTPPTPPPIAAQQRLTPAPAPLPPPEPIAPPAPVVKVTPVAPPPSTLEDRFFSSSSPSDLRRAEPPPEKPAPKPAEPNALEDRFFSSSSPSELRESESMENAAPIRPSRTLPAVIIGGLVVGVLAVLAYSSFSGDGETVADAGVTVVTPAVDVDAAVAVEEDAGVAVEAPVDAGEAVVEAPVDAGAPVVVVEAPKDAGAPVAVETPKDAGAPVVEAPKDAGAPVVVVAPPTGDSELEKLVTDAKAALVASKFRQAAKLYRDAQQRSPDDVSIKTGLGISLVMSDSSFKEAIGYLRDGVKEDPKNAQAWLALGIALQNLGRDAEAKQPYKEFLKLRPSGSQADEVRAALKAIP